MNECCANLKELLSVPCYSPTIMWGEARSMLFLHTNLSTLKIITILKRKTTAHKLLILLTRKQFILPYHLTDNLSTSASLAAGASRHCIKSPGPTWLFSLWRQEGISNSNSLWVRSLLILDTTFQSAKRFSPMCLYVASNNKPRLDWLKHYRKHIDSEIENFQILTGSEEELSVGVRHGPQAQVSPSFRHFPECRLWDCVPQMLAVLASPSLPPLVMWLPHLQT